MGFEIFKALRMPGYELQDIAKITGHKDPR